MSSAAREKLVRSPMPHLAKKPAAQYFSVKAEIDKLQALLDSAPIPCNCENSP